MRCILAEPGRRGELGPPRARATGRATPRRAVIALRVLLAIGPSFSPGKSAYEQGRMQEALGLLDRAVSEAPDEPDPYLYRALTRVELGDTKGARADFDRTLLLRPDSAMAHYFYGDLLLSAGELDRKSVV